MLILEVRRLIEQRLGVALTPIPLFESSTLGAMSGLI
jgi:hypothetical protein